ncbi:MAG: 16S rRNA (guanine(527)-N(7))-methyltransferase RsmG [Winogradskyella sp.]|nr:16S rRNA (guanine(527)-N(7))-methyltransferase RsmG [Winogradskyella sp.]MBT8375359.1 16S rRNA (guanine(527)-N(7))-methyltransferase RsmG [Bacteroidia bacterium]NNC46140.1 16S rRNA (guanine(527)-N(7))-methyltransferase RsmG [Winogradskyella sp.]NNF86043.1 16S rRNA (guanine(527)-N(7))-methyltransferase RsmG [Winogradskyella sp.]NNL82218.1 16S rRNA (guanine(527)-N(7))-methyltransferase RsmG [Winogradskyella sp.]
MELILKYFPDLNDHQIKQFSALKSLYEDWNSKINVVSRKDIEEIYLKHVLHSLGIAKVIQFKEGTKLLDVGTGGGFPGIPLAILFPNCQFHLVDSINKKLKVVNAVADALELSNIKTTHSRVEAIDDTYDFIISRAVTYMPEFTKWVKGKTAKKQQNDLKNGIFYLKGGDLSEELKQYTTVQMYELSQYFDEPFFETKKVVYLPMKYK